AGATRSRCNRSDRSVVANQGSASERRQGAPPLTDGPQRMNGLVKPRARLRQCTRQYPGRDVLPRPPGELPQPRLLVAGHTYLELQGFAGHGSRMTIDPGTCQYVCIDMLSPSG